jgi:hypothetical protein
MSKSRLTQAIVLGALLAAANLATMTAVAHAKSEPTLTHDRQRPPTQGQVGEAWHQPPPATHQSAIAGHRQRPPTEGQAGEPWHLRVQVPTPLPEPDSHPRWPVASLAVLTAALVLAGGLAARRASRRTRPRLTA